MDYAGVRREAASDTYSYNIENDEDTSAPPSINGDDLSGANDALEAAAAAAAYEYSDSGFQRPTALEALDLDDFVGLLGSDGSSSMSFPDDSIFDINAGRSGSQSDTDYDVLDFAPPSSTKRTAPHPEASEPAFVAGLGQSIPVPQRKGSAGSCSTAVGYYGITLAPDSGRTTAVPAPPLARKVSQQDSSANYTPFKDFEYTQTPANRKGVGKACSTPAKARLPSDEGFHFGIETYLHGYQLGFGRQPSFKKVAPDNAKAAGLSYPLGLPEDNATVTSSAVRRQETTKSNGAAQRRKSESGNTGTSTAGEALRNWMDSFPGSPMVYPNGAPAAVSPSSRSAAAKPSPYGSPPGRSRSDNTAVNEDFKREVDLLMKNLLGGTDIGEQPVATQARNSATSGENTNTGGAHGGLTVTAAFPRAPTHFAYPMSPRIKTTTKEPVKQTARSFGSSATTRTPTSGHSPVPKADSAFSRSNTATAASSTHGGADVEGAAGKTAARASEVVSKDPGSPRVRRQTWSNSRTSDTAAGGSLALGPSTNVSPQHPPQAASRGHRTSNTADPYQYWDDGWLHVDGDASGANTPATAKEPPSEPSPLPAVESAGPSLAEWGVLDNSGKQFQVSSPEKASSAAAPPKVGTDAAAGAKRAAWTAEPGNRSPVRPTRSTATGVPSQSASQPQAQSVDAATTLPKLRGAQSVDGATKRESATDNSAPPRERVSSAGAVPTATIAAAAASAGPSATDSSVNTVANTVSRLPPPGGRASGSSGRMLATLPTVPIASNHYRSGPMTVAATERKADSSTHGTVHADIRPRAPSSPTVAPMPAIGASAAPAHRTGTYTRPAPRKASQPLQPLTPSFEPLNRPARPTSTNATSNLPLQSPERRGTHGRGGSGNREKRAGSVASALPDETEAHMDYLLYSVDYPSTSLLQEATASKPNNLPPLFRQATPVIKGSSNSDVALSLHRDKDKQQPSGGATKGVLQKTKNSASAGAASPAGQLQKEPATRLPTAGYSGQARVSVTEPPTANLQSTTEGSKDGTVARRPQQHSSGVFNTRANVPVADRPVSSIDDLVKITSRHQQQHASPDDLDATRTDTVEPAVPEAASRSRRRLSEFKTGGYCYPSFSKSRVSAAEHSNGAVAGKHGAALNADECDHEAHKANEERKERIQAFMARRKAEKQRAHDEDERRRQAEKEQQAAEQARLKTAQQPARPQESSPPAGGRAGADLKKPPSKTSRGPQPQPEAPYPPQGYHHTLADARRSTEKNRDSVTSLTSPSSKRKGFNVKTVTVFVPSGNVRDADLRSSVEVSLKSRNTLEVRHVREQSRFFNVDEYIEYGGINQRRLPSSTLLEMNRRFFAGTNAAMLLASTPNGRFASGTCVHHVLESVILHLPPQSELFLSMALIRGGVTEDLLLLSSQPMSTGNKRNRLNLTYQEETSFRTLPLVGVLPEGVGLIKVTGTDQASKCIENGYEYAQLYDRPGQATPGLVVMNLVLKQLPADGDVILSSLLLADAGMNSQVFNNMLQRTEGVPHQLFHNALGGPTFTIALFCIGADDANGAVQLLNAQYKLSTVVNKQPHVGSIRRFVELLEKEMSKDEESSVSSRKNTSTSLGGKSRRLKEQLEMALRILADPAAYKPGETPEVVALQQRRRSPGAIGAYSPSTLPQPFGHSHSRDGASPSTRGEAPNRQHSSPTTQLPTLSLPPGETTISSESSIALKKPPTRTTVTPAAVPTKAPAPTATLKADARTGAEAAATPTAATRHAKSDTRSHLETEGSGHYFNRDVSAGRTNAGHAADGAAPPFIHPARASDDSSRSGLLPPGQTKTGDKVRPLGQRPHPSPQTESPAKPPAVAAALGGKVKPASRASSTRNSLSKPVSQVATPGKFLPGAATIGSNGPSWPSEPTLQPPRPESRPVRSVDDVLTVNSSSNVDSSYQTGSRLSVRDSANARRNFAQQGGEPNAQPMIPPSTKVRTLVVVDPRCSETSNVTYDNTVVIATTEDDFEEYDVDEVTEVGKESEFIASDVLRELCSSVLMGCNAAILCADSRSYSVSSLVLKSVVRTILQSIAGDGNGGPRGSLTVSFVKLKGETVVDLLGPTAGEPQKLVIAISPIFGSCVHGVQYSAVTDVGSFERMLNGALGRASENGRDYGLVFASLILKLKVPDQDDVLVCSLVASFAGENVGLYTSVLDRSPLVPRALYHYALGGPCYTVALLGIGGDESRASQMLQVQHRLGEISNRPTHPGSIVKFIKGIRHDLQPALAEKLRHAEDAEDRTTTGEILSRLEEMVRDAEALLKDFEHHEPKAYLHENEDTQNSPHSPSSVAQSPQRVTKTHSTVHSAAEMPATPKSAAAAASTSAAHSPSSRGQDDARARGALPAMKLKVDPTESGDESLRVKSLVCFDQRLLGGGTVAAEGNTILVSTGEGGKRFDSDEVIVRDGENAYVPDSRLIDNLVLKFAGGYNTGLLAADSGNCAFTPLLLRKIVYQVVGAMASDSSGEDERAADGDSLVSALGGRRIQGELQVSMALIKDNITADLLPVEVDEPYHDFEVEHSPIFGPRITGVTSHFVNSAEDFDRFLAIAIDNADPALQTADPGIMVVSLILTQQLPGDDVYVSSLVCSAVFDAVQHYADVLDRNTGEPLELFRNILGGVAYSVAMVGVCDEDQQPDTVLNAVSALSRVVNRAGPPNSLTRHIRELQEGIAKLADHAATSSNAEEKKYIMERVEVAQWMLQDAQTLRRRPLQQKAQEQERSTFVPLGAPEMLSNVTSRGKE